MPWLALGYPLLAHAAVLLDDARLEWLAIVWLLAVALSGALAHRRLWAWGVLLAGAAAAWPLTFAGGGLYALYVPPVLIPASLLLIFGQSLRPGAAPLVTRIATIMRGGALPEDLRQYTRAVTQLWCIVFVLLSASAVCFALWATPDAWSLMTNVIHYLVIGAVFVLEFLYRRIRYRHYEHDGLWRYLRRVAQTRIHG